VETGGNSEKSFSFELLINDYVLMINYLHK